MYTYIGPIMKKQKRVTPRRLQKNISRLRASAGGGKGPLASLPEWRRYYRPIKKPITLRLDADVLAWFQRQGRGYQTRINRALRKLMLEERNLSEGEERPAMATRRCEPPALGTQSSAHNEKPPLTRGRTERSPFHLLPDMPPPSPSCVSIEIRKALRSE